MPPGSRCRSGRAGREADAELAEVAAEDVGAVPGAVHPGVDDRLRRRPVPHAPGDVLAVGPAAEPAAQVADGLEPAGRASPSPSQAWSKQPVPSIRRCGAARPLQPLVALEVPRPALSRSLLIRQRTALRASPGASSPGSASPHLPQASAAVAGGRRRDDQDEQRRAERKHGERPPSGLRWCARPFDAVNRPRPRGAVVPWTNARDGSARARRGCRRRR